MQNKHLVFVYGTLRQHEPNHHFLKDSNSISKQSWTYGKLFDTGNGYPVLIAGGESSVYGEVYEVTDETLKRLDELEGYEGSGREKQCERVIREVQSDKGMLMANVYFSNLIENTHEEVPSGDWKCHKHLDSDEILYFAYGSCMDSERFTIAGVDRYFADIVGCGKAKNFTLAYSRAAEDGGRADMIESEGYVEGKVYQLKKEALDYLFVREGVAGKHYRPALIDVEIDGTFFKNVLTFLVIDKVEEVAPPIHYATEILRGAQGFVSNEYFNKLERHLLTKFNISIVDDRDEAVIS
ncbi:gamma-glutamylcyclotransferase [Sediminibacillus massiliensis]|uniref:gamma-glutamylcyclotransferase n=1 Tax=Sediminibacillus massiliensis TaxID=1926277 RepID=UPI0009883B47|nr:gamma-glutamylcyclotransferase [Sediminibacillus massiliensis]